MRPYRRIRTVLSTGSPSGRAFPPDRAARCTAERRSLGPPRTEAGDVAAVPLPGVCVADVQVLQARQLGPQSGQRVGRQLCAVEVQRVQFLQR